MPLETCGTVVEQQDDRVIVRVERTVCDDCSGQCIKFRFPGKLGAIGRQRVGSRVRVSASAAQVALASSVVFGVPLITLLLLGVFAMSNFVIFAGLLLSLLLVYGATRPLIFRRLMQIHAKII